MQIPKEQAEFPRIEIKKVKCRLTLKRAFSILVLFCIGLYSEVKGQLLSDKQPSALVNVFLGTSGDHGQVSPSASYPFGMMSIGPVTYPKTHTGYDFNAKEFLGFSHGRMEGVGCQGSGGNILVKPFIHREQKLIKVSESGSPGYYQVSFDNGMKASFVV